MQTSTDEFLWKVGQQIRTARVNAGLTQQYLADRLGITQQFISKIEKGRRAIRLDLLKDVADICGVPLTFFLEGTESVASSARILYQITPTYQPYAAEILKQVLQIQERDG